MVLSRDRHEECSDRYRAFCLLGRGMPGSKGDAQVPSTTASSLKRGAVPGRLGQISSTNCTKAQTSPGMALGLGKAEGAPSNFTADLQQICYHPNFSFPHLLILFPCSFWLATRSPCLPVKLPACSCPEGLSSAERRQPLAVPQCKVKAEQQGEALVECAPALQRWRWAPRWQFPLSFLAGLSFQPVGILSHMLQSCKPKLFPSCLQKPVRVAAEHSAAAQIHRER